jgi:hypothetical protein
MKYRRSALAVALMFSGLVGYALAQTGFQIETIPNGNEIVEVKRAGAGGNQAVWLTQLRESQGYSKIVPLTTQTIAEAGTAGASQTYPANTSRLVLIPAGTLAALTVTMPGPTVTGASGPYDGSEFCIYTTQTLTSLTMNTPVGQTLNGGLTTLTANTTAPCWVYSTSNTTWDRSQ